MLAILLLLVAVDIVPCAEAQSSCSHGARLEGTVVDPSGAVIPGARVAWRGTISVQTDSAGHYVFPCASEGVGQLMAEAPNFAPRAQPLTLHSGQVLQLILTLDLAEIQTNVQVNADTGPEASSTDTINMNAQQIQQLPDDPDDLLAQLQILAAQYGGDPSAANLMIDGFQNVSSLPPKSSIASIRINPDLFSSEYAWPPYSGGTIEITTKAGTSSMHGAVFFTGSPGLVNATDPLSTAPTPASRMRYGFELSDKLIRGKSDISLALEKRDINEFNVVNAQVLGTDGNAQPFQQAVANPQRLWIASARSAWQATTKDSGFLSYSANINSQQNQGVGGLALAEAGYTSTVSEYDLRLLNTLVVNPNLLHETRVGYSWKRTEYVPNSTTTSLQVAGYFTGGGALNQLRNDREEDLEIDDDAVWTRGRHTLKFGVQSVGAFVHDDNSNSFNGAFIFGGGSAPVLDSNGDPTDQTTTITSFEQYRRALAGLAGGTPTAYQVISGQPLLSFTQWKFAFFLEDMFKVSPRFAIAAGLRYQGQTEPDSFGNFEPRLGFDWAIDKRSTWSLHAHAGIFNGRNSVQNVSDVLRLDGIRQTQHNVYSPSFTDPLDPIAGSVATTTIERFATSVTETSTFNSYLNLEHIFPHQWTARINFYQGEDWNRPILRNINAPMVASNNTAIPNPTAAMLAPRPGPPDENIIEFQNAGHLNGDLVSVTLNQHSYKRFGISMYYRHAHFKSDGGDGIGSPQSAYTNAGESSRADWLRTDSGSLIGNVILPGRVDADVQFNAATGAAFNITTGTDNNGDGTFNDRPAYGVATGAGVYRTRYGLLSTNAINGDSPRNLGTMPSIFDAALNLNRSFLLDPHDKDHPVAIVLNARAANLLNHTNVTAVNQILSPTLGQPTIAQPARRIEFGARLSF